MSKKYAWVYENGVDQKANAELSAIERTEVETGIKFTKAVTQDGSVLVSPKKEKKSAELTCSMYEESYSKE